MLRSDKVVVLKLWKSPALFLSLCGQRSFDNTYSLGSCPSAGMCGVIFSLLWGPALACRASWGWKPVKVPDAMKVEVRPVFVTVGTITLFQPQGVLQVICRSSHTPHSPHNPWTPQSSRPPGKAENSPPPIPLLGMILGIMQLLSPFLLKRAGHNWKVATPQFENELNRYSSKEGWLMIFLKLEDRTVDC